MDDIGEIFYLPELYRLKALCIFRIDPENRREVEANFSSAYDFAEKIESHLFKLRTLLDCYKTAPNPLTQNKYIGLLEKTLEVFKGFKNYQKHYEVKEVIEILPHN